MSLEEINQIVESVVANGTKENVAGADVWKHEEYTYIDNGDHVHLMKGEETIFSM